MNKAEIEGELMDRLAIKRPEAVRIMRAIFSTDPKVPGLIAKAMIKGDQLKISGFGLFEARHRDARTARNPQTGEPVEVPAHFVPAVRFGKPMKELVKEARPVTELKESVAAADEDDDLLDG